MNSSTPVFESKIYARRVSPQSRLQNLPWHIGMYALIFESAVYLFPKALPLATGPRLRTLRTVVDHRVH